MKEIIAIVKRLIGLKVPRYPDIQSLHGAAGSLKTPLSWQQMREIALEDRLIEKYQKS